MRTCGRRFLVAFAVVLIGGVLGAGAGAVAGRALALHSARNRLATDAAGGEQALDTYASETRRLLAAMNTSPFAFCSERELQYFRRLLYQSSFVKEGGRFRNGRVACSAIIGTSALSGLRVMPGVEEPDGVRLYRDIPAFRQGMRPMTVVQLGQSYVVTDFRIRRDSMAEFIHLGVHVPGESGLGIVALHGRFGTQFDRDGDIALDGVLYSTRCSERYPHCVTASMSMMDALRSGQALLALAVGLCALAGSVVGLLCLVFHRHCGSTEQQLRRALASDEVKVVYQPIVDLSTGRRTGAEALARWSGDDGEPVSPTVFVRIAERRGFVGQITRRVIQHALHEMAQVIRDDPEFRLSVNVAAADLCDRSFLPMIAEALERTAVPPQNLVIELTETSTACRDAAISTIRRLRAAGHPVHIDDFGTGYSSLSYLKDLAVDAIKIDRSFTQSIGMVTETNAILPQIMAMADALQLQVVVEGIETTDQAAYFERFKRPILAQGWLYGVPAPFHEFASRQFVGSDRRAEQTVDEETDYALPASAG